MKSKTLAQKNEQAVDVIPEGTYRSLKPQLPGERQSDCALGRRQRRVHSVGTFPSVESGHGGFEYVAGNQSEAASRRGVCGVVGRDGGGGLSDAGAWQTPIAGVGLSRAKYIPH